MDETVAGVVVVLVSGRQKDSEDAEVIGEMTFIYIYRYIKRGCVWIQKI